MSPTLCFFEFTNDTALFAFGGAAAGLVLFIVLCYAFGDEQDWPR